VPRLCTWRANQPSPATLRLLQKESPLLVASHLAMLDAVYFDAKETKSVVAIQPKTGFLTVFQVAPTRSGHEVQLIKGPQDHGSEADPCFWWRRGGSGTIPETQSIRIGNAGVLKNSECSAAWPNAIV